jgi:hypothetical protein
MRFCVLVSALCILTSVGLGHDVSVDTILAPSGTIDSGQAIIPRVVVSNNGNEPVDGVSLGFTIDDGTPGYTDSVTGLYFEPGTETLEFGGWTPQGRDSMEAVAWLRCDGDTCPQNDTFRQHFLVRVRDLVVTRIVMPPPDTMLDSGIVFYPSCFLWGYDNTWPDTCIVTFRIGTYHSACTLSLRPWPDTVVAPDSYVTQPGVWACSVAATARGDLHPDNNIEVDTFSVTGNILVDVEAVAVLAPTGAILPGSRITPSGRVCNNGTDPASFWSFFIIENGSGVPVYVDSSQLMLASCDSTDVSYRDTTITVGGSYTAAESVYMDGDQVSINDVVRSHFVVGQGDIGITAIFEMPADTVDTLRTFHPRFRLKNYGVEPESGYVFLAFSDTAQDRVVYQDSELFRLPAGGEVTMAFDSVRFTTLGPHEGQSWFWAYSGYADTLAEWQFWVVPFVPGLEETMNCERGATNVRPTVVRSLPAGVVVFDATGRRVLNPNAGVYFVAVGGERSAVSVRKVVLQR